MTEPTLKSRAERPSLTVRSAESEDILFCSQLDGAYQTNYVWQMHFQESRRTVHITFNRVRLPRIMAVEYPYPADALYTMFEQAPYLLVAGYQDDILGCIDGFVERSRKTLTINNLIVHKQARRQGIGRLLLKAIKALAWENDCQYLTIAVQTKNDPTIEFIQRIGFIYCGYNDKYYPNGDIALFFSLKLQWLSLNRRWF